MRSYISLDGMMSYLETLNTPLFSAINLPSGIDRTTLINTIYQDGAEFGVIYPDPNFLRARVNAWFDTKYNTFDKWNTVLNMEYNPIENYDRMENWSDTGSITDTGSREDTGTSHDTTESKTELTGVTGLQTSKNGTTSGTSSDNERKQTDTTGTDTLAENKTETIDQDGTSRTVTDATTETETKVSAFNDGSAYQPKELVSSDSDTTVTGTTTNDQTTTTADNITKTTTGQEIEQTTASGTTSGTSSETGAETENKHDVTEFESESNGRTTLQSNTTGSRESDGEHEGRIHGNIGVVTSQAMVAAEIELRRNYNIYNMISDCFCDEFLIQVY